MQYRTEDVTISYNASVRVYLKEPILSTLINTTQHQMVTEHWSLLLDFIKKTTVLLVKQMHSNKPTYQPIIGAFTSRHV